MKILIYSNPKDSCNAGKHWVENWNPTHPLLTGIPVVHGKAKSTSRVVLYDKNNKTIYTCLEPLRLDKIQKDLINIL